MPTRVPTAVKNPCHVICNGRLSRGTSHLKRVGSMLIGMGQSSSGRDNSIVGLFDRFKRQPEPPVVWHVYREGNDLVADDGRGGTYRVQLVRAESVRIVPITGGNPHAGAAGGYQVAIRRADGDAPIGKPSQDWRPARDLA